MGKRFRKIAPPKPNKYMKICERCGNGGITKKTVFQCKYCGYINGIEADKYGVEISRGGLDDRTIQGGTK